MTLITWFNTQGRRHRDGIRALDVHFLCAHVSGLCFYLVTIIYTRLQFYNRPNMRPVKHKGWFFTAGPQLRNGRRNIIVVFNAKLGDLRKTIKLTRTPLKIRPVMYATLSRDGMNFIFYLTNLQEQLKKSGSFGWGACTIFVLIVNYYMYKLFFSMHLQGEKTFTHKHA